MSTDPQFECQQKVRGWDVVWMGTVGCIYPTSNTYLKFFMDHFENCENVQSKSYAHSLNTFSWFGTARFYLNCLWWFHKMAANFLMTMHDDVIKWKHFPPYWPFVRGIHRPPVNSPHKGQWRGAWMFSLICVWINGWVNNREAGDWRLNRAHYDVIVMFKCIFLK